MSDRPNVLLLFTDMQRADTVHALGNPVIKTPNLDRLATEGMAFTNAFSPCPVCVPARYCMHYGVYATKADGLTTNGRMPDDNGQSIQHLLTNVGYRTHGVGKCHFTPDKHAMRGFETRMVQEECVSDPEKDDYCAWLVENGHDNYEPMGARGEMYYIPQVSCLPAEAHPTQWVGDRSIDFVREQADEDKPWMLFSSYIHPHPPFAPPKPWHKLYRSPYMPLPLVPQNVEALQTVINRKQNRYKYRDQGIDQQLMRNIKAYYYAAISFVDYQVGRIIDALEETGQLDNTLIIFTSDHGELLGDYNCFGKRSMHDAASRVPMLVRYPKRFAVGKECRTPVNLVDVMPTIAEAAGLKLDDVVHDGVDMAAIANGECPRDAVFSIHGRNQQAQYMIVTEDWKYFYSSGDDMEYLFDRNADPNETRNVANIPFSKDIVTELKDRLLARLKEDGIDSAYVENDGKLDWKKYDCDESYLNDPDAGLIFQDSPAYPLDLPGYGDQ